MAIPSNHTYIERIYDLVLKRWLAIHRYIAIGLTRKFVHKIYTSHILSHSRPQLNRERFVVEEVSAVNQGQEEETLLKVNRYQ